MIIRNNKTTSALYKGAKEIVKRYKGTLVVYEAFKKLIASGVPPITLQKCKGVDLVDYKIYGSSEQNGTPTPEAPIEIESVGDKTQNILPYPYYQSSQTVAGVTYTVGDDGGITISGTSTKQTSFFLSYDLPKPKSGYLTIFSKYENTSNILMGAYQYDASGTYLTHRETGVQYMPISMEVLDNTEKIRVVIKPRAANVECSGVIYPMILDGNYTEGLQYEPYGYRIPVKARGNNLIDFKQFKPYGSGTITFLENGLEYTGSYYISIDGSYLKAGNTYCMSWNYESEDNITPRWRIQYTDNTYTSAISNRQAFRIPTDKTVKNMLVYPEISGTIHTTKFTNIMLSEGELTDYEPYVEPITTNIYLNEPLRKIGDYSDYIDFEKGKVVRNINKVDLKQYKWYQQEGTYPFYYIAGVEPKPATSSNRYSISNILPSGEISATLNNIGVHAFVSAIVRFRPDLTVYDTLEKWTEYINNNECYLVYASVIKEETITLPNIPTFKGTTIIEVDTSILPSNMEVKYYGKE